jgi:hypothetical protein
MKKKTRTDQNGRMSLRRLRSNYKEHNTTEEEEETRAYEHQQ